MRLAYFSPFNPVPSGISDYSEELLPLLARARFADITLIVDHFTPTNAALAAFPRLTPEEFKARAGEFDLALYHVGNSPAHDAIYKTLLEIPGVVVLHDVVLHHLRAWQTLDRGDARGYIGAMRAAYGEAGAHLAAAAARGHTLLNRFDYPLHHAVVRAAQALIVHSAYAARQIQPLAPHTPIAIIPHGMARAPAIDKLAARRRLNLPPDVFIVAAFGEIHPHKRVTVALQAFAEFHAQFPNSLFMLIGRPSPNYEIDAVIATLGLRAVARVVGFAPKGEYADYIAAVDVCLNLRYPSAGETSGSLLRLCAAGKAVVVTRTSAYAEIPDGVCAKIEADEYEQPLLRAHLELFAARPALAAQLGANARAFVAQCHTLERTAAAFDDFLRAVQAGRAASKSYLVDWSADRPTGLAPSRRLPTAETFPMAPPAQARNASAPPPVAPEAFRDALACDYAELGLDAEDATLRAVAAALVELGF